MKSEKKILKKKINGYNEQPAKKVSKKTTNLLVNTLNHLHQAVTANGDVPAIMKIADRLTAATNLHAPRVQHKSLAAAAATCHTQQWTTADARARRRRQLPITCAKK